MIYHDDRVTFPAVNSNCSPQDWNSFISICSTFLSSSVSVFSPIFKRNTLSLAVSFFLILKIIFYFKSIHSFNLIILHVMESEYSTSNHFTCNGIIIQHTCTYIILLILKQDRGGGAVGLIISHASGRLGVRTLTARDLSG